MSKVCEYFKDGKCTIYETRPQTCRDFEVGSPKCLMAMKAINPEFYAKYIKGDISEA